MNLTCYNLELQDFMLKRTILGELEQPGLTDAIARWVAATDAAEANGLLTTKRSWKRSIRSSPIANGFRSMFSRSRRSAENTRGLSRFYLL